MARAGETLLWWVVLVGLWVSTLSTVTTQELVVAGAAGLVCALVAVLARRAYHSDRPISLAKAVKTIVVSASPTTVVLDDKDGLTVHTLGRK